MNSAGSRKKPAARGPLGRLLATLRSWGRGLRNLPAFRRASRDWDRRPCDLAGGGEDAAVGVFVPGWSTSAGVGAELMQRLARRCGLRAVHYCGFGPAPQPHEDKRAEVVALLDREELRAAPRVIVVAHSYGGLIAAAALLDSDLAPRCHLFTLNTPFLGPRPLMVPAGHVLSLAMRGRWGDEELRFMRGKGDALRRLRDRLAGRSFRLTTIAAPEDELVSERSATIAGCEVLLEHARGHTGLLVRPAEIDEVAACIAARACRDADG